MVVGIAATGGIGFTVSLFIAELAFAPGPLQESAKLGVLGASTLAASIGLVVLVRACKRPGEGSGAPSSTSDAGDEKPCP